MTSRLLRGARRFVGGLFFVVFVVGGGKLFAGVCRVADWLGAENG